MKIRNILFFKKNIHFNFFSKFINFLNTDQYIPFIFRLFLWWNVDFFRLLKNKILRKKEKPHVYGIYGYFGLWGMGKTITMTKELFDLRCKYKDEIYIFTNYGFKLEDKPFSDWRMLLVEYDKPAIFAWDEVQNEFNSRDFKSFPTELLTILTQNRKGNGKRILYTAQRWTRVDKVFRELTYLCFECKTRLSRLTSARAYFWEDYEDLLARSNVEQKIKIHSKYRKIFIQTDYLRSLYNSYQMLDTAKKKTYIDRDEVLKYL